LSVTAQAGGVVEVGGVGGIGGTGVVPVVEDGVVVEVVVDEVDAAVGSVVDIGVLVPLLVLEESEPESECFTFDVAAVAAPATLSLMTGAASLACCAVCCTVCCTLGLLVTRVAAWRSCS
jgi:hypothetical protein